MPQAGKVLDELVQRPVPNFREREVLQPRVSTTQRRSKRFPPLPPSEARSQRSCGNVAGRAPADRRDAEDEACSFVRLATGSSGAGHRSGGGGTARWAAPRAGRGRGSRGAARPPSPRVLARPRTPRPCRSRPRARVLRRLRSRRRGTEASIPAQWRGRRLEFSACGNGQFKVHTNVCSLKLRDGLTLAQRVDEAHARRVNVEHADGDAAGTKAVHDVRRHREERPGADAVPVVVLEELDLALEDVERVGVVGVGVRVDTSNPGSKVSSITSRCGNSLSTRPLR